MTRVDVHHVVEGPADAPVLVLANSLGTDLAMWEPQVGELARHFRVVRYDHRGHGGSPVPPGPYTLEELAEDVLALLDELGVARAHYCGLSLGGMVGIRLAVLAPERVDRLMLCCTSAALPPDRWVARAATVRAEGVEAVADAVLGIWFTEQLAARDPELRDRMRAMLTATPAEGYASCCDAIASMDLLGDLGSITAPTLVLAAADDPATPPEHAYRIAAAVPGSEVAVVEGAAHLANIEQPDAVTRLLLGHLGVLSEKGRS